MSNIGLFAMGSVVTLLVAAAMALLIWGAIMDGRSENKRQAAEEDASVRTRQDQARHAIDAA